MGLIVTAIMGAVFFTLVLLTGNAMAQAARERISEMAILQAIGFTGRRVMGLLLGEALLLLLLGSTIGLVLAVVTLGVLRRGWSRLYRCLCDRKHLATGACHRGLCGSSRRRHSSTALPAPADRRGAGKSVIGAISQAWSVTRMAVATMPQRRGACLIVVVSIACVVGVLVALLAMGAGFAATLQRTGRDDTALVLQAGAQSEAGSTITHDVIAVVSQAPQVLKGRGGHLILSPDLLVSAALPKKEGGLSANVAIRGVGDMVWDLRPQIKLVAGRKFDSGLNELLVGQAVHEQLAGAHMAPRSRSTASLGRSWAYSTRAMDMTLRSGVMPVSSPQRFVAEPAGAPSQCG